MKCVKCWQHKQRQRWKANSRSFSRFHVCEQLNKHRGDVGTHHTGSWVRWTLQDSHRAGWNPPDNGPRWSTHRSCTQLHTSTWTDRWERRETGQKHRWAKQSRHLAATMRCQHLHFQTVTSFYQSLIIACSLKWSLDSPSFTLSNVRGIHHLVPPEQRFRL